MRKIVTAAVLLSLVPTAALADKKKNQSADMGDPDRIICETVKVTGSRLARQKTCHTAGEWAELRRQQRGTVDRIQAYKPATTGSGD